MSGGPVGAKDRRAALALAVLSSFLTPFMASSINVALPSISTDFAMTTEEYGWVATSYLLAAAAFLVPFGRLADIKGRKRVFIAGMWVFAIASIACALAPSSEMLISFRFLQGFGGAMVFGTSIAILTSVYPPNERGKVIGLSTSVVYIGLSAGPVLGGFLTSWIGWRSIFLVLLPGVFAIIWIAAVWLKGEWAEAKGEAFDLRGSVIYVGSLTAAIVGITMLPDVEGIVIALVGGFGVVVFVVMELKTTSPVLNMSLFRRNRSFAFSNLAALINYSATYAVGFLMAIYLVIVRGFDAGEAGVILVSQTIIMAVFSPLAGKLSDAVEPQVIASVGMGITAVGLLLLSFVEPSTDIWIIVVDLIILGFGFALFSSPNTNAIMSSVDRRQYGVASATVGTMRLIGQVLSLGLATFLLSVYVGDVELTADSSLQFMDAFEVGFAVFAVLCFFGVLASLARGKIR